MRPTRSKGCWETRQLFCATALVCAALSNTSTVRPASAQPGPAALRDPAWSPDSRWLAASVLDQIWIIGADGKNARSVVTPPGTLTERDPAWSPDGGTIAFSADAGTGFDLYVVASRGGAPKQVTSLPGDERWPTWWRDGRLVFAHSDGVQWDLYVTNLSASGSSGSSNVAATSMSPGAPTRLTDTADSEMHPRVSPDSRRLAFVSDRDSEDRDLDLWVMPLSTAGEPIASTAGSQGRSRAAGIRVARVRGADRYPSWSPEGDRLAFFGERAGVGSVWVTPVDAEAVEGGRIPRDRPPASTILLSRHGGNPAWAPDGRTIAIGTLPDPEPDYNGNPERDRTDPPPLFSGAAFMLWTVPAPVPVDATSRALAVETRSPASRWTAAFDRVWTTLNDLYYSKPPSAAAWEALRTKYRGRAQQARDMASLEAIVDDMVAEQPLIKRAVGSSRAVISSGHLLASEAGALAIQKGGNIVDAAIAVSFALGVVEPDASGVGGDGTAVLFLKGMERPVVVDYKDETPSHATSDNPRIFRDGRLVPDGAAAANIPGVVAGLDHLYQRYGSGKVPWADLIQPAIHHAEDGFVLDEALPTTIAEGQAFLKKYPEARRIFLPGGKLPQPGDRFVNKDYAGTLRAIAAGGAEAFYRGAIARQIAEDMRANGGIITYDDLAQYRAIERVPLSGRYRHHTIYSAAPPVASGASLIETLQILDRYTPGKGATITTDPEYFHYLIEAWKARDQIKQIADPGRWTVDLGDHLSPAHAAELFKRIDPSRASGYRDEPREDDDHEGPSGRIGRGTTGFVVADADGNMIAITQTLSTWGGTFYVSKGLGFLYNNHLRSNRTASGTYGQLLPLTRSSTTANPTLVFDKTSGTPVSRLAVAAAGNAWITASVYSIIAAVLDGGLPAQRAIEAPRFLVGRDPADREGTAARTEIEDRIPRGVLQDLMRRGHRFQKIGRKGEVRYGYASLAVLDVARGRVDAGAEPRRSHAAAAPATTTSADERRR